MRLKEEQVKQICQRILLTLRTKQLIQLIDKDTEILKRMEEIFFKELRVEDEINRDAEKLLEQYARSAGDKVDREKLFQMIKKQLVKERNVIL